MPVAKRREQRELQEPKLHYAYDTMPGGEAFSSLVCPPCAASRVKRLTTLIILMASLYFRGHD